MLLKEKILNKNSGLLFYGLTPPKLNTDPEKIHTIAKKQIERLKDLNLDGLILYDLQDESSRTDAPRPFPFLSTLDPDTYAQHYLSELAIPKIIYKSIGKQNKEDFVQWICNKNGTTDTCVFVGAPSKNQHTKLALQEAYQIKKANNPQMLLGGVTIPERHLKKGDEHLRVFQKIENGCQFFISQCVYNLESSKNFLADYYYWAQENQKELVPIIFTLTPCGSVKTLEFMNWLGIDIPNWLKADLKHSNNILEESVEMCNKIAQELLDYARKKKIPIGFNIESVAIRKEEIEASISLVKTIRKMMNS
ncbi:methylenetetrahydrofolate reductase [Flavicella sediminum]|uniref:methylenetetrahydrofolate reductase n=1 Tax=Flavicella sediminum TaxID=2585141 RepID=UPI001AA06213|nr:methylenetetrahydrofolate reductase [Flavicella sediminum]